MSPPFRPISFIDSRYTDGDGLTKPEAHVVQEDSAAGGDSLARTFLDHCKAGLAPYKYPRWFRFVDELPLTSTGRVRRFKLREGVRSRLRLRLPRATDDVFVACHLLLRP